MKLIGETGEGNKAGFESERLIAADFQILEPFTAPSGERPNRPVEAIISSPPEEEGKRFKFPAKVIDPFKAVTFKLGALIPKAVENGLKFVSESLSHGW